MTALPPLCNLRIHEACIGAGPLQLRRANASSASGAPGASGARRSGRGSASRSEPDAQTEDAGADMAVEMYTKSGTDGATEMGELIKELKEPRSTLAAAWHVSLAANLRNKKYLYCEDQLKTEARIDEELALQNEVWKAATGRTGPTALPTQEKHIAVETPSDGTGGSSGRKAYDANKIDVVDASAWKGLVAKRAATEKILNAIGTRLGKLGDTDAWKMCVAELINALQQLLDDYPDLSALLQKVVAVVRAFIRAPMVLSKQFLNMMITGDAGTGKTRLAETVGPVFARLGLYVYEEVVVASANDFIGEFVGQTEQKTADFLSKHAEKVIFLDEAYSLTLWEEKTPGNRQLAGYSPEAVAQLIAVLSQSVGRFLFIVAGYDREMREDFLAANDGFDRRFPIRVVLGAPDNDTLVRAFFGAIAEAVVGPAPPASANGGADRIRWKENKHTVVQAVTIWFSDEAVCLLCDVLNAARQTNDSNDTDCRPDDADDEQSESNLERYYRLLAEKEGAPSGSTAMETEGTEDGGSAVAPTPAEYDAPCTLAAMFRAGAGAMVNLAGTAAVLIISSGGFEGLYASNPAERKLVDERAMRTILLAFISDKHSQSESGREAAEELDGVLVANGWMQRGDGGEGGEGLTWTSKRVERACVSAEKGTKPLVFTDIVTPIPITMPPASLTRRGGAQGDGCGGGGGDEVLFQSIADFVAQVASEEKRKRPVVAGGGSSSAKRSR